MVSLARQHRERLPSRAVRGNAEQRQLLSALGVTNTQTVCWSAQTADAGFARGLFASQVSAVTIPQINILPNTAAKAIVGWTQPT